MNDERQAEALRHAANTLAMLAEFFRLSSYEDEGSSPVMDGLYAAAMEESERCSVIAGEDEEQ